MKKVLSLLLALLMLTAFMPMAFALDEGAPVLIDPINDPPVASPIEQGARLRTSTISGGAVKHPVTGEPLTDYEWIWDNGSQRINAAGSFSASCISRSLSQALVVEIPVSFVGSAAETEVSVSPVIADFSYGKTWADIEITGGTVVEKGTDTVVKGTFTHKQTLTNMVAAGEQTVKVYFTPDDTEKYLSCETTVSFNVAKATPAWKDGVIPTCTIAYGSEFGGTIDELAQYLAGTGSDELYVYLIDENGEIKFDAEFGSGQYPLQAKVKTKYTTNTNWDCEDVVLDFILNVVPGEVTFKDVHYNYITGVLTGSSSNLLYGTVDITIGGTEMKNVPLTYGGFEVNYTPADTSKDSEIDLKIVYNAAEGDNAVINAPYESTVTYRAERKIDILHPWVKARTKYGGDYGERNKLYAGEVVVITAGSGFVYWEITDKDGNSVIDKLEHYDNTTPDGDIFRFYMPDYDLVVNAVHQYELDAIKEKEDAINNCDCLCHSDNAFVQFFWKIITTIINLIEQLTGKEILCRCGYEHCS